MSDAGLGLCEAFRREVGEVDPVAVEGERTCFGIGGPLDEGVRLVRAPEGVVDHRPEEMTVRVLAGTSVADLHAKLAEANQRSALPERGGTVGGALAVGQNELRSWRRGRVRDALLEARYVSADGRLVRVGAPTVKNVSGFDVPRLLVGSLGTLGLLAEVVLRTQPIPVAARWLSAPGADPFRAREVASSATVVLWDGERTWVELEGLNGDVDADADALGRLGEFAPVPGPPELPPQRWSLRPSALRTLEVGQTGRFVASIGVGLILAERPQPPRLVPEPAREVARRLKEAFDPGGRLAPGRDPERAR